MPPSAIYDFKSVVSMEHIAERPFGKPTRDSVCLKLFMGEPDMRGPTYNMYRKAYVSATTVRLTADRGNTWIHPADERLSDELVKVARLFLWDKPAAW
ncbi:MAG: hypothetical protein EOO38_01660 [Cytophagaceae bacterium]|nr:MAG: hypothetical protein EOO38_01660 [Cytophagaceae bacterium]